MSAYKQQNVEESIDEFGFQEKVYDTDEVFQRLRQYDPVGVPLDSEKIKLFAVSALQIVIVTDQNKVYRLREEFDQQFIQYTVPEKKVDNPNKELKDKIKEVGKQILFMGSQGPKVSIDKIFLDPLGYHCLLTCDSGCSFYFNYDQTKIKFLKNLKGSEFIIKSIGWDDTCTNQTTKNIILGTQDSVLYIYKIEIGKNNEIIDSNPEKTLVLKGGKPIVQIYYLKVGNDEQKIVIIVSTSTSIFSFQGTELNLMFQKFKTFESQQTAELQFASTALTSIMSVCFINNEVGPEPHSFIWTNGYALQYYDIPKDAEQLTQHFLSETKYYKYAKMFEEQQLEYRVQEMPIDLFLSEFHYFILHSDSLTIMSRINEKIVQKFDLKSMGIVYGMNFDNSNQSLWIYSSKQIQRLSFKCEAKEVWRLFLERKEYQKAYEISMRTGQDATEYLGGIYADQLFEAKQYQEAANQYFGTSRSFEEITLKFLTAQIKGDMDVVDGLENFKSQRPKAQHGPEWLKYKEYKRWDKLVTYSEQTFETFLTDYCNDIPEESVYQIMQSHGRLKECLAFAQQKNSYEMMIQHYINEEQFDKALSVFRNITNNKKLASYLQKYCHILLQKWTYETIDLMKKSIDSLRKYKFRIEKLIIGLMNVPQSHKKDAISFVQLLIDNHFKDKTIHNIYIYFLCDKYHKSELKRHLIAQEKIVNEGTINFDIDFALRLTSQKELRQAQIQIYGMMNLYSEAIDLALNQELIETAIEFAQKPDFKEEKKKKMWLKIATHLLNKGGNNVQEVLKIINNEQQFIKIEDLLIHFNENIKIENFKDQICDSLQSYNCEIKELKETMKVYSDSADKLQSDLKMIKNRYIEMNQNVTCMECCNNLFKESFYIFPCIHGFHKACLILKMKRQGADLSKLNYIELLNQEIEALQIRQMKVEVRKRQQGSGFFNNINQIFSGSRGGSEEQDIPSQQISQNEERDLQEQKAKLDQILASECIFCGPGVVDNIFKKYESDNNIKTTWDL